MRGTITVVTETAHRKALIEGYCKRFKLGAAFRLAISRCKLYELRPDYFRYIDNSRFFGENFEITIAALR